MKELDSNYRSLERGVVKSRAYLYEFIYKGINYYLTNYDSKINYFGLEYIPVPIKHSEIDPTTGEINIELSISNNFLKQFFTAAPSVTLGVKITRVVGEVDFISDKNSYVVYSGYVSAFQFTGNQVSISCIANGINESNKLPKHMCQHYCNWKLYGMPCGINKEDFKENGTIYSFNYNQKIIIINGVLSANKLFNGSLLYQAYEYKILKATVNLDERTILYMVDMPLELEQGKDITVYFGCRKTTADCATIFDNLHNFGGMPYISDKNLGVDGVT